MVVIDATMLLLFLRPETPGPKDAEGNALSFARQRIEHLISDLDDKPGEKICVPTPALSEVLVKMSPTEARKTVAIFNDKSVFSVEPFDQRAAIEVALMAPEKPKEGPETWAKLKYDRQIAAIAKVCKASKIYSDDGDIHTLGERMNISVYRVRDLPLPPDVAQTQLFEEGDGSE